MYIVTYGKVDIDRSCVPNILLIDFETTGLDTTNDRIIEIGAILFNTNTKRVVKKYSTLVRHTLLDSIPADIVELTKITPDLLNRHGTDAKYAFKYLMTLIGECDYVLAHNGISFDYPMLTSNLLRLGMATNFEASKIDSCTDFPYPANIRTRKLSYLIAEHGLTMSQPAHCAIADCESLLSLLMCYDIEKIIERSHEPNVVVRAIVHRDDNPIARSSGFRYTNNKWVQVVKESEVEALRSSCPFPVV